MKFNGGNTSANNKVRGAKHIYSLVHNKMQSTHSTKSQTYHCGEIPVPRERPWVDPRLKSKHILGLAFSFPGLDTDNT